MNKEKEKPKEEIDELIERFERELSIIQGCIKQLKEEKENGKRKLK